MPTCLDAARLLMSKGMRPVPLMAGTKRPCSESWPTYNAEPWTLERDFTPEKNIGVILGDFVDVDLDCPEAIALAPVFLPPTPMKHGRTRAPNSHWWYRIDGTPIPTRQFRDEKSMLTEFRALGGQTMVPWSRHPDTNEVLEWEVPNPGTLPDLVPVTVEILLDAVAELAAATLMARHWPEGSRHDLRLALAGVLLRGGWPAIRAERFIDAVSRVAGDPPKGDTHGAVRDTEKKLAISRKTTGIPGLKKLLGGASAQATIDRLLEWLRLSVPTKEPKPAPEPTTDTLEGADAAIRGGADPRIVLRGICQRVLAGDLSEVIAKPMLSAASGRPEFDELWRVAMGEARLLPVVPTLSHKDPQKTARAFLTAFHVAKDGTRLLQRHREEFFRWRDGAYHSVSSEAIHRDLATFMESGRLAPTKGRLGDAEHLLKCECHIPETVEPPSWLGEAPDGYPDYAHLVPMRTGLLSPADGTVHPPTPLLFNLSALPFDYNPEDARTPSEWMAFLKSLWPEDVESVSTLQEMFGYLLTPDTSMQKMFILKGPRRSGKGTIARVLRRLLGEANCAGPSMSSLASNFGCSSLIGKTCAIVSDARMSGKTDQGVVCDRLLSISGEDSIDIDRKNKSIFTTQLKTRMVILCNLVPKIADPSNALSGRFVLIETRESFYGREDQSLLGRLIPELPQILHWALEGRRRLYERGYFDVPVSSAASVESMEREANPVGAFVSDKCAIGDDRSIYSNRLYDLYLEWCKEQGIGSPVKLATLATDLRAAFPKIEGKRARNGALTVTKYTGIGEGNEADEIPD